MSTKPTPTQRIAAGLNESAKGYAGRWKKQDDHGKAHSTLGKGYEENMNREGYFRDKSEAARQMKGRGDGGQPRQ